MIKLLSLATVLSLASASVLAVTPECELNADKAWMDQEAFESKVLEMGYMIEDLVVSEGNCFEVTGTNQNGQEMTAWFHPQTGDVLQEDVVQ